MKWSLVYIFFALIFTGIAQAKVDLVQVDKSERRMFLIEQGETIKEYQIALGGSPKGHKTREGDPKTPEGRYVIDYKKEDSSYYRAMHVSYPNENDIKNAQDNGEDPGGFIMVHGQRNWFGLFAFITQRFN